MLPGAAPPAGKQLDAPCAHPWSPPAGPPARRTFALRLALSFAPEEVLHVRHGSSLHGLGLGDSSVLYGRSRPSTTVS